MYEKKRNVVLILSIQKKEKTKRDIRQTRKKWNQEL